MTTNTRTEGQRLLCPGEGGAPQPLWSAMGA